jgi:hypothetical protein
LWPRSKRASSGNLGAFKLAEKHAQKLEGDFTYVLTNMRTTILRIEKDISLLMALVAINEGRQSLQENRGISFLTLVATIFLPCQTVASVLGIQTQYAPGARYFWMLWVVALPLTILVITVFFLYPTVSSRLNQLRSKYILVKKESKEGQEKEEENGSRDESFELPEYSISQTANGSVV